MHCSLEVDPIDKSNLFKLANLSKTVAVLFKEGDVVLGSTKEECCERLECATYTCSNPALMTKSPNYNEDGTPR
eukprot:s230_g27.t1